MDISEINYKKEEYIKSLDKVKLVIGNGFDKYCNLDTSYRDYFLCKKNDMEKIRIWSLRFEHNVKKYTLFNKDSSEYWEEFEDFEKYNVWDFFFYYNSKNDNKDIENGFWCNIEKLMLDWFKDKSSNESIDNNWKHVYQIINGKPDMEITDNKIYLLAAIAYKKNGERRFADEKNFYVFLLNQLKIFEKNFGKYIYELHYTVNYKSNLITKKTLFKLDANNTIKKLCNMEKLVSIDSFNYDNFDDDDKLNAILNNVNGDVNEPIFGIDSTEFDASDNEYIFTKTYRRMDLDMHNKTSIDEIEFKNMVIFGHSLDKSDYSYFFSMFDRINIMDIFSKNVVVFAFSIYDRDNDENIRMHVRDGISKLFQEYAKYKGMVNQPNRLLDTLTIQRKIMMYEI